MDIFTQLTIVIHALAVLVLVSTLPRQIHDIWGEKDSRYRKICWVVFLGTVCLIAMNIVPLMQVVFYENVAERIFWNIVNTFNGIIAILLGVLAHMMFKSSKITFPHTIDIVDNHHKKNEKTQSP